MKLVLYLNVVLLSLFLDGEVDEENIFKMIQTAYMIDNTEFSSPLTLLPRKKSVILRKKLSHLMRLEFESLFVGTYLYWKCTGLNKLVERSSKIQYHNLVTLVLYLNVFCCRCSLMAR